MQTRALVKERARRNLLLLIDGIKSEEMLLSGLTGVTPDDFRALEALGLIAAATTTTAAAAPAAASRHAGAAAAATPDAAPLDYSQFTATLTQLISSQLGLRGFVLSLAVEKAGSIEELQAVAQRTLEQIGARKGEAAAAAARQALYGG